jgi:hypothetical protein
MEPESVLILDNISGRRQNTSRKILHEIGKSSRLPG